MTARYLGDADVAQAPRLRRALRWVVRELGAHPEWYQLYCGPVFLSHNAFPWAASSDLSSGSSASTSPPSDTS
jgi:plasmid stabilization system protein ParE